MRRNFDADIPSRPQVPWSVRDTWAGVACLGLWAVLAFGTVILVRALRLDLNPGLVISALELPLLLPVWWFACRKYRTGWGQLGLAGFKPGVLGIGIGLMFLVFGFNILYSGLLARYGLRMQLDLERVFEQAASPWPLVFGGVVIAPFVEEIFFRGFVFAGLKKGYSWKTAMVVSAALFALIHLRPLAMPPIFLLGLVFAYLYQRSGSIFPAIILHILVNGLALGSASMARGMQAFLSWIYLLFQQLLSV